MSLHAADDRRYWGAALETPPRATHKAKRVEDRCQQVW